VSGVAETTSPPTRSREAAIARVLSVADRTLAADVLEALHEFVLAERADRDIGRLAKLARLQRLREALIAELR
jgi:hypothetical protein